MDHILSNNNPIFARSRFWNSRLPRFGVTLKDALSDGVEVECRWDYIRRWPYLSAHKFVRPPRLDLTKNAIDFSPGSVYG